MGGGKTNLEETNVGGLLTEALTADVHLNEKCLVSPAYPPNRTQFEKGSGEIHTPYLRIRPARWEQTRLSEKNIVNNHSIRPHLRIPGSIEFSPVRIQYPLSLLFSLAFLLIRFVHPSIRPSIIHFIELEKNPGKMG